MEGINTNRELDFFNAISNSDVELVKHLTIDSPELLRSRNYSCFGATPLTQCSNHEDTFMIDTLIDLGADLDQASDWWAGPWNPIQSALSCGNDKLANYFASRGATIDVHEAAGLNQIDRLKDLLNKDQRLVDKRGGDGCFPLHFAASEEVVDILLTHGADINGRDIDHYSTATQYLAPFRPAIVKYLFDKGAEADIFTAVLIGDKERFDTLSAAYPSLQNYKINQDTFPPGPDHDVHNVLTFHIGLDANLLHTAAIGKQINMIEHLVNAGISPDSRGGYDESTAMHMVAWRDYVEVAKALKAVGADIDLRSGSIHDNTPAGWAIVGGSPHVFCFLIDQGAIIQPYFKESIEAGLKGEFLKYKKVPLENYKIMLDKIS